MTELYLHITHPGATPLALGLARACQRTNTAWACFFTFDGVGSLADPGWQEVLPSAVRAVVCGHSWQRYMGNQPCPVEQGSQTVSSQLVGEARHVIGL